MSEKKRRRVRRFSSGMRRNPTISERAFEDGVLRPLYMRYGIKYKMQKVIWDKRSENKARAYILGFYLADLKMAVEIDGKSHQGEDRRRYDAMRDSFVASRGIKTLRFMNEDTKFPDMCLKRMYKEIEAWPNAKGWFKGQAPVPREPMDREKELKAQEEFIAVRGVKIMPTVKAPGI